jgi:hypothetical protein
MASTVTLTVSAISLRASRNTFKTHSQGLIKHSEASKSLFSGPLMESTCTLTASKRILMVSKVILTAYIVILMVFTSIPMASSSNLTAYTVYLPSQRDSASTFMGTTVTLTVSAISLTASRNTIKTSTIIFTAYSSTLKPLKP